MNDMSGRSNIPLFEGDILGYTRQRKEDVVVEEKSPDFARVTEVTLVTTR